MRDDRDQGVLHRGFVPPHQCRRRVAGAIVERREDNVEALQQPIGKIKASVGKNVDFDAVKNGNWRVTFTRRRNRVRLPINIVQ